MSRLIISINPRLAVCAFIKLVKTPFFGFLDRASTAVLLSASFFQDARGVPLDLLLLRQTSEALCCAHLYKVRAHAFERVSVLCGSWCGRKSWRDSDRDAALRITHLSFVTGNKAPFRMGFEPMYAGFQPAAIPLSYL